MRSTLAQLAFAALLSSSTALAAPHGEEQTASASPAPQIRDAFERGDYRTALNIIETQLTAKPDDTQLLYRAGCAAACLGHDDESAAYLARAVNAGFMDYALMRVDPDLESIREHPVYVAIIEEADRILAEWRADPVHAWQARFGTDEYRFEQDAERRLWYATALDESSHASMTAMIKREADYLGRTFFGGPPDYDVLVAAPTAEHASLLFHGKDRYGGVYEHGSRRLIARDIGSSLRHEFFHLMHFGHMQRMGKLQPIWIQEGWASLYEDCVFPEEGGVIIEPSHRADVVYHVAQQDKLLPWSQLLTMNQERFMADAGRTYAQSRSIFQYMEEKTLLDDWYRQYVISFDRDPTGARAIEEVFGTPIDRVERAWLEWVHRNRPAPLRVELGESGLGLKLEMRGSNDGVLVTEVTRGSEPQRSGICAGDVIVAVNDRTTRSFLELRSIVGRERPGTWVDVLVRRGDDYQNMPVKLSPARR